MNLLVLRLLAAAPVMNANRRRLQAWLVFNLPAQQAEWIDEAIWDRGLRINIVTASDRLAFDARPGAQITYSRQMPSASIPPK